MRITYNELIVYTSRAFNSLHRKRGEADIIASAAADLEAIGKSGLRCFVRFLKRISCDNDPTPEITIASEEEIFVDLKGSCVICYLPNLINYALENKTGDIVLKVMNEFDNWLALGRLLRHHISNYHIYCTWKDDMDESLVQYLYDATKDENSIYVAKHPQNIDLPKNMLSITFSEKELSHKLSLNYEDIEYIDNDKIINSRRQSLSKGLFVYEDDWQYVKELASRILIPESEQSQGQAGGK